MTMGVEQTRPKKCLPTNSRFSLLSLKQSRLLIISSWPGQGDPRAINKGIPSAIIKSNQATFYIVKKIKMEMLIGGYLENLIGGI